MLINTLIYLMIRFAHSLCYDSPTVLVYRKNPLKRREIFHAKMTQKISSLINKVFGHIGIYGKVRWHHMVMENADHRCRDKAMMMFTFETSSVPLTVSRYSIRLPIYGTHKVSKNLHKGK